MKVNVNINCPVSADKVNEHVVRAAAFFTIGIVAIGLYYNQPFIVLLLAVDFMLRAFTDGNYSPVKFFAKKMVVILNSKPKLTDAAPKKFAASLGVLFCMLIVFFQLIKYTLIANFIAGMLLVCAGLEGALGICLGCIVYTFFVLPFYSKK